MRLRRAKAASEKSTKSTVGTQKVSPTDVVASLQERLAKAEVTANALATYRDALRDERDTRAKSAKLIAGFTRLVEGMFFDSPTLLADFGLKPASRAKRSVAEKAIAVEKAKATREARHPKDKTPTVVAGTTPVTTTTPS